jgi:NAD(P)-dependent dehydrogenase (short-subunit alcohol dehydrogenase family)
MTHLSDRRVLVIGGSGYIGSEVVRTLLREGARVASIDVQESKYLDPYDTQAKTVIGDVTDNVQCQAVVGEAVEFLGGLDALVYAAGVMLPDDGKLGEISEQVWDKTLSVNARGAWLVATHSLRSLRRGSSPSIVFIGSVAADRGSTVSQLAYAVSKGAIATLTTELAISLASDGIRVNRVSPGPLQGGLLDSRLSEGGAKERRQMRVPAGRLGKPADVARACVFLIEPEGDYMTGANLVVDGGLSALLL